jgi:cobalt/nickel transport system ATP-binding protein
MTEIISITGLSYRYPDGKTALENISLQVRPGERIALVGANGAGKSTLLLHLNGLLSGSGTIFVKGLEVKPPHLARIRAVLGIVFQDPDDQLFSASVLEDVAFGPIYQGLEPKTVLERVDTALAAVGMSGCGERNPHHLSGGEKKRIAIASVLSMQPEILALDEPTAGLDPRARRELLALLQTLPQTMLIATHDLPLAQQLTPRMLILNAGKIVADGETKSLLADEELLLKHGLR